MAIPSEYPVRTGCTEHKYPILSRTSSKEMSGYSLCIFCRLWELKQATFLAVIRTFSLSEYHWHHAGGNRRRELIFCFGRGGQNFSNISRTRTGNSFAILQRRATSSCSNSSSSANNAVLRKYNNLFYLKYLVPTVGNDKKAKKLGVNDKGGLTLAACGV